MRLAWLTDIHLDFLSPEAIGAFGEQVASRGADAVVVTGDISVAAMVGPDLARLVRSWRVPCYFVAGNHDYYGASIGAVRRAFVELGKVEPRLRWLPAAGVVRLTDRAGLVGVDGWGDGRLGNPETTPVVFNDQIHIEDLVQPDRAALLEVVRALGDEEAETLSGLLTDALGTYEHVYVATHIPPFREASTHAGERTGDDWLPWMTCHAVGEMLRGVARAHPERRITVLAGHTHDRCHVQIAGNLEVRTGAVEYGAPSIQDVIEV